MIVRTIVFSAIVLLMGGVVAAGAGLTEATSIQKPDELAEADKLGVEIFSLYKLSKFEEAVPLAKRALKIRQKALPANDARIADAQTNLAELYLALEKYEDAESLFAKAIKIYEVDSNRHAKHLANALERRGLLKEFAYKYAEAESAYVQAITLRERVIGTTHTETNDARDRLAAYYMRRREFAKALPLVRQQVAEGEKKLGPADPQLGQLLERLSCVLFRNKETAEAEKIEARANRILYAEAARKNEPVILERESFECRLITNPRPDFAKVARSRRFIGKTTVVVALEVNETGQVNSAQTVMGDPIFKEVAEKAALTATVRPLVVDGQPVKFKGTVAHEFGVITTTRLVAVPVVVGRP